MTKKNGTKKVRMTKRFKSEINTICKRLRWEFYLNEYTMHLVWMDDEKDGKKENSKVAASIDANFRYLEFTLHIYPLVFQMWEKGDHRLVHRTLIHEFTHMLIDPVYYYCIEDIKNEKQLELLNDIRERQVQRTANLIEMYLPKKIWEIKKKPVTKKKKRHGK